MAGVVDLGPDGYAVLAAADPVDLGLRTPAEQTALIAGFAGLLHALTAGIQILNAIGALTLVYAFRHGKAIVVAPLTNAGAPLITAVLALIFAGAEPGPLKILGLVLALAASLLLVLEPERPAPQEGGA